MIPANLENNSINAPSNAALCASVTPEVLTGSLPTGGNGAYHYQWQQSSDGTHFTIVEDATDQHFTPAELLATTFFRRLAKSGSCDFIPSEPVRISVVSLAHSTLTIDTDSLVADGTSTAVIALQLKDALGDPVAMDNCTPQLETSAGHLSALTYHGNGSYTAVLTAPVLTGTTIISGSWNNETLGEVFSVAFIPGSAHPETSQLVAQPASVEADGESTITLTLQLKDSNGNNLVTGGDLVELFATRGTLSSVVDNLDGTYTVTLTASTVAGVVTISASINGEALESTLTVDFVPGAASEITSVLLVSSNSMMADGLSTVTVTLQAKDQHGNLLTKGGADLELFTTHGTLSAITDHHNGTYTAVLTSSTTPGEATLTGKINGEDLQATVVVQFIQGDASAITSTLTVAEAELAADGLAATLVTVQLKDAFGNNLTAGGDHVEVFTTHGTLSTVTDNLDGTYSATLTSSLNPGLATLTAKVNGTDLEQTATVQFVQGSASAATSVMLVSSTSIVADGISTLTITIRLKDADGNDLTVGGDEVELFASDGSLSAVVDNHDGTYSIILTASTTAGSVTLTGKLNGTVLSDSKVITFLPGAASAITSVITASSTTLVADGISTTQITIQVKDSNQNNLVKGGDALELFTTGGTLSAVLDHGDGTYTSVLTASTLPGLVTITGKINDAAMDNSETVTFIPGDASVATTTLSASPNVLVADGTSMSTLTVQVKDAQGNNLTAGGDLVELFTTGGTLSSVTDLGNGTYTTTLTASTTAGPVTVTGKLNGVALVDDETVNFIPGAASALTSVISASASEILADGSSSVTITVQLKDVHGNNLTTGGNHVVLHTTLGTIQSLVDHGNGTYTATLVSSNTSGQAVVTGMLNTESMTGQVTVTFTQQSQPILSATIVSNTDELVANGTSQAVITITVVDQHNNPISNAQVILNTTAGTLSAVVNHQNGTYTASLTSSVIPQVAIVSFTLNGQANNQTVSIEFTLPQSTNTVFIPEGFSPDGDGVNDTFVIYGAEGKVVNLKVFNRWGNIVYESRHYQNDWDGTANNGVVIGQKLPDGTYFYAVDFNDGQKPQVRYFTIKRKS